MWLLKLKEVGHRRWRLDLSAYVDGHLEPPQREALEVHLARCTLCQEEVSALRRMVALLRRLPQVAAPRSFALAQAPSAGPRWPAMLYGSSLRYATTAAALLLLVVVVGDLATSRATDLAPATPGAANIESKKGSEELQTTHSTATVAPLVAGQDTPSHQQLPLAASEKSQEPMGAGAPLPTTSGGFGALHDLFRWGELALGAILAALITLVSIHWWQGRRTRER